MPLLIALSLAFYSYWDVRFLPIMIFSMLGNWLLIRLFVATKIRGILTAVIVLDLSSLGIFHHIMYLADLRRGAAPIFSLDRGRRRS